MLGRALKGSHGRSSIRMHCLAGNSSQAILSADQLRNKEFKSPSRKRI